MTKELSKESAIELAIIINLVLWLCAVTFLYAAYRVDRIHSLRAAETVCDGMGGFAYNIHQGVMLKKDDWSANCMVSSPPREIFIHGGTYDNSNE